ncbi:Venom carboxylesterase-6 [Halotydeus destructor]|nr:Venom carboxylesterase-6 [Halotydeus destructor]
MPSTQGLIGVTVFLVNCATLITLSHCQQFAPNPFWPEIRTVQGLLRGRTFQTNNGKEYFAFLGIPYATPPTGQLRFKPPVLHPGWSQILSATAYKNACPQFDSLVRELGDEDCLYLNVYTPEIRANREYEVPYPVMVYLQAESYENGDSSLYGPEKLVEKDVLVVTFNYRLGLLGFLSTEDDAASGNWGLHDQRLALEWVKGNIDSFGGDPNKVTLFGQGAGAASTFLHMMSPASQGLFHRAIMQSGSALCDWAIERSPLRFARDIAESVGCPSSPTNRLVDCLRTISPKALLKAQSKVKIFGEFPQRTAPVVEKAGPLRFMTEEPRAILARGTGFNRIPLMIGTNADETAYFYPLITEAHYNQNPYYHEQDLIPRFLEAATFFKGDLKDRVMPAILYTYFNGVDLVNLTSVALRFVNVSSNLLMKVLIELDLLQMTGDALYNSCVDETVNLYGRTRAPVYRYVFEHKGQNSMVNLLVNNEPTLYKTGVCHGDELFYLFNLRISGMKNPSEEDMKVENKMLTLWTDFAKNGYAPRMQNYDYPKWEVYEPERRHYYRIGRELSSGRSFREAESQFWSGHLRNVSGLGPFYQALSVQRPMYKTLAWAMVAVSVSLLVLVAVLLCILYMQRRHQVFKAQSHRDTTPSHLSIGSTLY